MTQLLDDLVKAQPDSLFIIAGLVLILLGVIGSIKTYIDPGKNGRIAACAIGVVLVIVGFVLYARQPAPTSAAAGAVTANPAGTSTVCTFNEGPLSGATHELPRAKPQAIGSPCHDLKGNHGLIVAPTTPVTP